jgi:putative hydrolases of HD superfamily
MHKLLRCLTELEKLKLVERGLNVGIRKESSAEHSWSCMLIADIVLDLTEEPLCRLQVFEYLLYHDLAEVYAGDAKFNNPEEMRHKSHREAEAHKKIIQLHPFAERYKAIVTRYEQRLSREAQFAKAIDCIDACVRSLNDDTKHALDGFNERLIREKYAPHVGAFPSTSEIFELLMAELKRENKI